MEDIFEELGVGISDEDEEKVEVPEPREDEAEEANEGTRRVVKAKRTISRPRPKLDAARLLGPRGMFTVRSAFEGVKFKGKGHELDDLNNVLTRLQHWAHRLFPKLKFADCIEKIEDLGQKREILTNMHKLRMGIADTVAVSEQVDDGDEVIDEPGDSLPQIDVFDALVPVAPPVKNTTLTEEQRARMMRNRLLAEERRMARRLAKEIETSDHENLNPCSSTTTANTHEYNPPNNYLDSNSLAHRECDAELNSMKGDECSSSVSPSKHPISNHADPLHVFNNSGNEDSNQIGKSISSNYNEQVSSSTGPPLFVGQESSLKEQSSGANLEEQVTDEQRASIMRNRLLAEERRMVKQLAKDQETIGHVNSNVSVSCECNPTNEGIDSNVQMHCKCGTDSCSMNGECSSSVSPARTCYRK